jgi:hypothetical protein
MCLVMNWDAATSFGTMVLAAITAYYAKQVGYQSTIMRDNMQRDSRLKDYERHIRAMVYLVGPLYAKKENKVLFDITATRPNRDDADWMWHWKEYYKFWDEIKINAYLGKPELISGLNNYFRTKDNYWDARGDHLRINFDVTEDGREKKAEFELKKSMLTIEINEQYKILNREINQLQQELGI